MQSRGEELVRGLKLCLQAAMKKFHEVYYNIRDRAALIPNFTGAFQIRYHQQQNYTLPILMQPKNGGVDL